MYPSTNTRSGHTTSTETTKLAPSNSSYEKKTDLDTTITSLFSKLDDKIYKLYDNLMESINNITALITEQDAKFE